MYSLANMDYFNTIGLELSRKCNASCPHCITAANSKVKTKMSFKQIDCALDSIVKNFKNVCFTGGEPFVSIAELKYAVLKCSKLGLRNIVLTNGFWASSFNEARNIIKQTGVSSLEVSYDLFHEKMVPFNFILNLVAASKSLDCKVTVRGLHIGFNEKSREENILKLKKKFKDSGLNDVAIGSSPLTIFDNSSDIFSGLPIKYCSTAPKVNSCISLRCPFISSDGTFYYCCSSLIRVDNKNEVTVGNIFQESLESILSKVKIEFLPNFIMRYGPQGVIKLLLDMGYKDLADSMIKDLQYNDICHLCLRIFSNSKVMSIMNTFKN